MISVVMLTFNRENLVSRAIEGVLAQTYRNFEFIIVDNGSSDRSGQIVDEYAGRDARIRVIHKEKGNIGSGRNAGLDAAQGDYIAFIDDDDYTEPGYLEYLHNLIIEYHADIAVCGSWREVEGSRQPKYVFDGVFTYSGEEAVYEMLQRERFNAGMPTKLIASRLFQGLRYDHSSKYDDIRMTYRVLSRASSVTVAGVPLYTCIRHRHNNSTGTTGNEVIPLGQVEEYLDAFRERTVWLSKRFPDKAEFWLYTELSYALSMYDKTREEPIRAELGRLLIKNSQAFLSFRIYFTERDKSLVKKYGGMLNEGAI